MAYLLESGIQVSLNNTTWYKLTDHNRQPIDISPELIKTIPGECFPIVYYVSCSAKAIQNIELTAQLCLCLFKHREKIRASRGKSIISYNDLMKSSMKTLSKMSEQKKESSNIYIPLNMDYSTATDIFNEDITNKYLFINLSLTSSLI